MSAPRTRLDPHGLAERILPTLAPLDLAYTEGHWTKAGYLRRFPLSTRELEALVSRTLREVLEADRLVTSALVREVMLALAGMCSSLATRLIEEAGNGRS